MYSMVLMAAMLPSGDAAGFGKKSHGCNGGCSGTVVAAGCTGAVAPAGCSGSSCHGSGGFLGLRNKGGSSCCGGGGFLGKHKHKDHGCNGGCSGYVPAGCSGGGAVVVPAGPVATPEAMPKK
jgi:hypothetical protein